MRPRLAFLGELPVEGVFPPEMLRVRNRGHRHPAPWIATLLPALARLSGFELRMVMVHRALPRPCQIEREGVTYEGVPTPWLERWNRPTGYWTKTWAARRALRRFQPHLIHAFGFETGAPTIALRTGFPVSAFIQGIMEEVFPFATQMPLYQRRLARAAEARAVSRVRWMVAETEFARRWALRRNPAARIALIPHPLAPAYHGVAAPAFGPAIVTVASFSRIKGVDTTLRAFAQVGGPEARLIVIGDGPDREKLHALTRSLGISERVEFTGPLTAEGIIARLRAACAFVCASRMDTSPNAVTEAHAAGLPVIGTRAGGIPEMVADGVDGLLADVDDAAGLAAAMRRLLGDPDLARRMGEAGRAKVLQWNDPEAIARAHVAYFREVLAELGIPDCMAGDAPRQAE